MADEAAINHVVRGTGGLNSMTARAKSNFFGWSEGLTLEHNSSFYLRHGKRMTDLVLVAISAIPVLIILAVLSVIVASDGHRPFFGHERIGRNGRRFKCWKVRSMVPDASQRLREHLRQDAAAKEEWDRCFKLENDPRITRLGRFLRKTSIDELPQLWNIARGEMSFVGPRPVTAAEIERYGSKADSYYALSPGLTGSWQVSGRNDLSYDERVDLDVRYGKGVSFFADIAIIWKTAQVVVNRTGK